MKDGMPAAEEGSGNESSSELEWRQEWDADSAWRPWAVHPDPIGAPFHMRAGLAQNMRGRN